MEPSIYPRPEKGFFALLSWEFQRFLERFFPEGLYARALLIVVMPVVLLQISVGYFFIERYYEQATKSLAHSYVKDISHILDLYRCMKPHNLQAFSQAMNSQFGLGLEILREARLPLPSRQPPFSSVSLKLSRYLLAEVLHPFWINLGSFSSRVDVRILVSAHAATSCAIPFLNQEKRAQGLDVVFRFLTPIERVHASPRPLFLVWMIGSSVVLLTIAFLFLRHQIAPILRLADAAEAFGMGKTVVGFKPGGAKEIRAASQAFLTMKARIEKQVGQRTLFLAGISHDLRTILTRLHLGLALLSPGREVEDLKQDAVYMQNILQHYLDFAKSEIYEPEKDVKIAVMIEEVLHKEKPLDKTGVVCVSRELSARVRPALFQRVLQNLVQNAFKFSQTVMISASFEDGVFVLEVEDDGPGISEAFYEQVFDPFFKLDEARTLEASGSGLGLTIAKEGVQAHGGEIHLGVSRYGGLKVSLCIPHPIGNYGIFDRNLH